VSVTYGDVGIDGPTLSELAVISVVEISVSVNVDCDEISVRSIIVVIDIEV
jgi:hypothetical protein